MIIKKVKYLGEYKLHILFKNKEVRDINLGPFLRKTTNPIIKKYLDKKLFSKAYIDETGTLCWGDNEFDISPESILDNKFAY